MAMDAAPTAGNPILANLFQLNLWANLELIDACAALDPTLLDAVAPGTQGSIRTTLWHIIEAERRFTAALSGEDAASLEPLPGFPAGELATLRVFAIESGEALEAWAENVSGDPMLRGEWTGGSYHAPASLFAGQALQHATEHRAQIQETLLRAGIQPPELTAWAWWRTISAVGMESPTI
jgi:uncharacterized damage-inducible protein DinB